MTRRPDVVGRNGSAQGISSSAQRIGSPIRVGFPLRCATGWRGIAEGTGGQRGRSATAYWQSREAHAIPVLMRDCGREVTVWKRESLLSIRSGGSRARARRVTTRARTKAPFRTSGCIAPEVRMTYDADVCLGSSAVGVGPIRALGAFSCSWSRPTSRGGQPPRP